MNLINSSGARLSFSGFPRLSVISSVYYHRMKYGMQEWAMGYGKNNDNDNDKDDNYDNDNYNKK